MNVDDWMYMIAFIIIIGLAGFTLGWGAYNYSHTTIEECPLTLFNVPTICLGNITCINDTCSVKLSGDNDCKEATK
jgi:hypothetical protein